MVVKTQDVRTPCYSDIYNIINNYTNTYYLYTLLFAKLYAENVINKAFHKHVVASFTGAWIETYIGQISEKYILVASFTGTWIETFNPCLTMCKLGRILYGCDTFLFQSVQIIIVSIYLVSSFHY